MIQAARCLLHRTLPLFWLAALGFALSGCAGHKPPVPLAFYDSPEAALRALAATIPRRAGGHGHDARSKSTAMATATR